MEEIGLDYPKLNRTGDLMKQNQRRIQSQIKRLIFLVFSENECTYLKEYFYQ